MNGFRYFRRFSMIPCGIGLSTISLNKYNIINCANNNPNPQPSEAHKWIYISMLSVAVVGGGYGCYRYIYPSGPYGNISVKEISPDNIMEKNYLDKSSQIPEYKENINELKNKTVVKPAEITSFIDWFFSWFFESKEYEINLASENSKYNEYVTELKTLKQEILKNKAEIKKQEAKLKNVTFFDLLDRVTNTNVVAVIGPTKYGKSVICNRLDGEQRNIDEICGERKGVFFNVGRALSSISQTNSVIKKIVEFTNTFENKSINLSILDTPGAFDSKGADENRNNLNMMIEYFRNCGGINIFCVVFKLGNGIDLNYQKLLENYEEYWGKEFWEHCVFAITHCDDGINKDDINEGKKEFVDIIKKLSGDKYYEPILLEFGENNYEHSKEKIFDLLNNKYKYKHNCKTEYQTPLDKVWIETKAKMKRYKKLRDAVGEILKEYE